MRTEGFERGGLQRAVVELERLEADVGQLREPGGDVLDRALVQGVLGEVEELQAFRLAWGVVTKDDSGKEGVGGP